MRMRIILLVAFTALLSDASIAGVLRVEKDGSGDYVLIQDAVIAAADGDTILIGPGRYDDLQPRGVNNVVCVAYWEDSRDLAFIGEDRDSVIIGPASYSPLGTGPQGIHQHAATDLRVESMTFENLRFCIVAGDGHLAVLDANVLFGEIGLSFSSPASCIVRNSSFTGIDTLSKESMRIIDSLEATVADCEFDDAGIYFGNTPRAVVSGCTVTSGEFVNFFRSSGEVLRSIANCTAAAYGIGISECDTIRIEDSTIAGGLRNVSAGGAGTVLIAERNIFRDPTYRTNFDIGYEVTIIAHDNDIYAGAGLPYVVEVCCYPVGTPATIDMSNNYWGEHSNAAALDSLIYDGNDDPNIHVFVNYEPIRTESVPTEQKSLGGLKSLYRGR